MKPNNLRSNYFMKWKVFSALMCLTLVRAVWATVPLYQNFANLNYFIPGNPPPVIDATNFDNESVFAVTYNNYAPTPQLFETWNTLAYTNNGTMIVNSPIITDGNLNYVLNFGCGFRFDTQTTNVIPRVMADTFYNPGTIRCDSVIDGNNIYDVFGSQLFILTGYGECIVSATNIIIPGYIDVGPDDLMQLTGQNVDFTRSADVTIGKFIRRQPDIRGTGVSGAEHEWLLGRRFYLIEHLCRVGRFSRSTVLSEPHQLRAFYYDLAGPWHEYIIR